jgi:hypothetical protein
MLNPSELLVEASLKLNQDEIDHWKLVDQLYLWEAAYIMEDLSPSRARKAIDGYHNRENAQPTDLSGLDDGGSPAPHPLGLLRRRIANHKDLLTRAVFSGEIAPITFHGEVHEASIRSADLKEWMVKKGISRSTSLSSGRYPIEEEIDRLKTENQRLNTELEQYQAFMNYEKPLAHAMLAAFDKFWRYPADRPGKKEIVFDWLTEKYTHPPEHPLLTEKVAADIAKVLMSAEARNGGRPKGKSAATGGNDKSPLGSKRKA